MKSEFERIRDEIITTAAKVRAADEQAAQHEQEIRREYDKANERKTAALDSGDMDAYRAAGMEAEARRLDLEFIEGVKRKGQKPAATVEDNSRILAALRAEYARIRSEGLARLKERFSATAADCDEILQQFAALDRLAETWGSIVMRQEKPGRVVQDETRLFITQMENTEKGQVERFKYIH